MKEELTECDICDGSGEVQPDLSNCKTCKGKKVIKEKKVLECSIDKGSPDGEKYIFHGEADEFPDKEAGDVVFIVAEQIHQNFKRKGADLLLTKEITLTESVCGADFVVDFIDGTKFRV